MKCEIGNCQNEAEYEVHIGIHKITKHEVLTITAGTCEGLPGGGEIYNSCSSCLPLLEITKKGSLRDKFYNELKDSGMQDPSDYKLSAQDVLDFFDLHSHPTSPHSDNQCHVDDLPEKPPLPEELQKLKLPHSDKLICWFCGKRIIEREHGAIETDAGPKHYDCNHPRLKPHSDKPSQYDKALSEATRKAGQDILNQFVQSDKSGRIHEPSCDDPDNCTCRMIHTPDTIDGPISTIGLPETASSNEAAEILESQLKAFSGPIHETPGKDKDGRIHSPNCDGSSDCVCFERVIHTEEIMTAQQILDKGLNRTLDNQILTSIPPMISNEDKVEITIVKCRECGQPDGFHDANCGTPPQGKSNEDSDGEKYFEVGEDKFKVIESINGDMLPRPHLFDPRTKDIRPFTDKEYKKYLDSPSDSTGDSGR